MVWPSAPGQLSFSIPTAIRKAGSPIRSAASAWFNIALKSGADSKNCGAIFHFSAHRRRVMVCVLREPASKAKVFACSMGFFAMMSRLRTCFFEAMAMPGKITKSSMRWYSIAGMMATSARRDRKSSAHCEGTVNDKSYLPRRGPLVKPQTSGAVLRYWTIEMRSLVTVRGLTCEVQYNKGGFAGGNLLSRGIVQRLRNVGINRKPGKKGRAPPPHEDA